MVEHVEKSHEPRKYHLYLPKARVWAGVGARVGVGDGPGTIQNILS